MPQEIANRHPIAPTPQTREFRDLLGVYANKIETTPAGKSLTSVVPTPVDRARIEARHRELAAASQATDPKLIVPRIARLFLRFPSAKIEDPAGTTAAYATDLASFPLWAIEAGIVALLKGHGLESKSFAPSSIIVREAVACEVAQVDAELAMIARVLGAVPRLPVVHDADRKARLLADARRLAGSCASMARASAVGREVKPNEIPDAQLSPEARQARHMARLEELKARPVPPIGPALRRSLEQAGAIAPERPQDHQHIEVA